MAPIPCKRPKVTVDEVNASATYVSVCHVFRCGWLYPGGPHLALKTDAEEQAKRHRRAHRDAVPKAYITTPTTEGPEYNVYCEPCGGHRRTFGTRADSQAWLDYHLADEHGLVSS